MTIDTVTNILMQQIQTPILNSFSEIISQISAPLVLIIVSLIVATYLYVKVSKKKGILLATTILITGGIVLLIKETIRRVRPSEAMSLGSDFSFPSGHATIAVVFFGLIIYLFITKRQKLAAITTTAIILIISFTRLYLGVHWLTDVIAGIILGTIILILSIKIYNKITSPKSNKYQRHP